MFDISGGEFLTIIIVAAVLIGPRQLPVYAKKVGTVIRNLKMTWEKVRQDVDSDTASQLRTETADAFNAAQDEVRELTASVKQQLTDTKA